MIRKPWLLIASVLLGQLVCVIAGVLWYSAWQQSLWRGALQERFLTHNELLAAHTSAKLARDLDVPESGPLPATKQVRLQEYVESVSLPKRWYLCVIDESGTLVADPRLSREPELQQTRPGHWLLRRGDRFVPLAEGLAAAPEASVAGIVRMADGDHLLAAKRLPSTGLTVLVHQPTTELDALATSVVAPIRRGGIAIGLILVAFTGLITRAVMGRYENRLAVLNAQLERKVRRRSAALLRTRDAVIFGLAKLADSRDRDTGAHVDRIEKLTGLLARELGKSHPEIDHAWLERLRLAAVLHDIGKVGIPDAILRKPGPLTTAERETMQRHTEIGADCLDAIGGRLGQDDFLAMARDITSCHHERWDGRGYPRGLSGTDIPLAARIVALADVYDAASSKRVYKPAQPHALVRESILQDRGKHLDPAVVDAFLAVEGRFRDIVHGSEGRDADPAAGDPEIPPGATRGLVYASGAPQVDATAAHYGCE